MYSLIKPILFSLEPENAHHLTLKLLNLYYRPWLVKWRSKSFPKKPVNVFGMTFPNPVGLAAGFAKEGDYIDALFGLGFGFIELGTVTPQSQPGNPKPRIFRIPEVNALINRMGFPSKGVNHFVNCMRQRKVPGIVGVNLGINKTTALHHAIADYRIGMNKVYPYADYIALNISSPNTPGLRELQNKKYLENLLVGIKNERELLIEKYNKKVPLLVKISVDVSDAQLLQMIETIYQCKIDGIIATNTSTNHQEIAQYRYGHEQGGVSGRPIFARSTYIIQQIYQQTEGKLPIIAVGGIMSPADAQVKIDAGASLVQIYTGLIYQGPKLIADIVREIKI